MKVKIVYLAMIIALGILAPQVASAQIDPPDDPIDTPFDGGVSLLVATAVGYGAKKAYDEKKKRKQSQVQ